MQKGFRTWFEATTAIDAIVGVVSGGELLGDEEKSHLMGRKITDFSSDIRSKIKNLGVVKSLPKSLRPSIYRAVDKGATVRELASMVSDHSFN